MEKDGSVDERRLAATGNLSRAIEVLLGRGVFLIRYDGYRE